MSKPYHRGITVRLRTSTVDEDGTATTPDISMVVNIYDPDGVALVSSGAMTEESTGSHYYDYTIATDAGYGLYSWQAVGVNGALTSDGVGVFEVQEYP